MLQDPDDKFFQRADAHIDLANSQTRKIERGRVSASFMYALSRFNAYIAASEFCSSKEQMREDKEKLIEYFTDEYRKMLSDNMDDYILNYNLYLSAQDKKS